jgi:hypothetical protein
MLVKDTDEEGRRQLTEMIMTPPEARLTGDDEIDAMPAPSWWHGEDAAAEEAQMAKAQLSRLKPTGVD